MSTRVMNGSWALLDSNTSTTLGTTYTSRPATMPKHMIGERDRVEHRAQHLLADRFAVLGVVRQTFENGVEITGHASPAATVAR